MTDAVGYPPLDRPKPVDEDIWIVDAAPIRAGGLPLPLRMTVLRLAGGELLLYSPTRHTAGLQAALEGLGPIRHLVAPNVAHWMFLRDWQRACPDARSWGAPGLGRRAELRRAGVRIDTDLGPVPPAAWRDTVDQVLVHAGPFAEIALFHRASRSLLVTDLVLNVEGRGLAALPRTAAGLLGILAPEGKAPLYLRLLLAWNGRAVVRAADRMIAFGARRLIMTHGRPIEADVAAHLRASLGGGTDAARPGRAAALVGTALLLGLGIAAVRRRKRR